MIFGNGLGAGKRCRSGDARPRRRAPATLDRDDAAPAAAIRFPAVARLYFLPILSHFAIGA